MLFGEKGPVPDAPEHVKIPPELLFDMADGREYLLKQLGPGWQSVEAMRKNVKKGERGDAEARQYLLA